MDFWKFILGSLTLTPLIGVNESRQGKHLLPKKNLWNAGWNNSLPKALWRNVSGTIEPIEHPSIPKDPRGKISSSFCDTPSKRSSFGPLPGFSQMEKCCWIWYPFRWLWGTHHQDKGFSGCKIWDECHKASDRDTQIPIQKFTLQADSTMHWPDPAISKTGNYMM